MDALIILRVATSMVVSCKESNHAARLVERLEHIFKVPKQAIVRASPRAHCDMAERNDLFAGLFGLFELGIQPRKLRVAAPAIVWQPTLFEPRKTIRPVEIGSKRVVGSKERIWVVLCCNSRGSVWTERSQQVQLTNLFSNANTTL
eukprot:SAG31_NODE_4812_length_2942_cov_1.217024_1_plen_145_part_10